MKKIHIPAFLIILVSIFFIAIGIRIFIGQPCYISSSSMENTLLEGDYVWLDRLSYGARLPERFSDIPLLNIFTWIIPLREADEKNDWGYNRIHGTKKPELLSIAVYNPTRRSNVLVVKRIAGLPGDTVALIGGRLQVNGCLIKEPKDIRRTRKSDPVEFPKNTKWNTHDYGPIIVPAKGLSLELNSENFAWVQSMALEEGNSLSYTDSSYICNEDTVSCYTFCENYYFMLGDNRRNSLDSRFTGFIPERSIEGTIRLVLFSNDTSSFLGIAFRTNRLLRLVK